MTNWGIIGCGSIANKMADALSRVEDANLLAVAARDLSRAQNFARKYGVKKACGSYAELAADPEIDAVYVATVHPTHRAAAELCLKAGKPVLCEKPLSMTAADDEALFALAKEKDLLLVEAVWTRFMPAWRKAAELAASGAVGEIKTVFTDFHICLDFDPQNRIYNMEKGGGSLLDLGVYSLHAALNVLGEDVRTVKAVGRLSPTGSDAYAAVTMGFDSGVVAVATCGCDCRGGYGQARYMGDKGVIILPGMVGTDTCVLQVEGQPEQVFRFPCENGFTYEVEEFQRLMKTGEKETRFNPPAATLAVARIIDEALAQING